MLVFVFVTLPVPQRYLGHPHPLPASIDRRVSWLVSCLLSTLFWSASMHSISIKRPKSARKLKMSDDNEEETTLGIRAPIIGYEVVDRREKFTVISS